MKRTNLFATSVAAAILIAASALVVAACGQGSITDDSSNHSDLRGVTFHRPDKIEGYNNVDGQPNLIRLCIGGVAFATSSRQYDSVIRVTEWDGWCGTGSIK